MGLLGITLGESPQLLVGAQKGPYSFCALVPIGDGETLKAERRRYVRGVLVLNLTYIIVLTEITPQTMNILSI